MKMSKMSEVELESARDQLTELKTLYAERERIAHEILMLRCRLSKLVTYNDEDDGLNALFTECEIDFETLDPL